MKFVGKPAKTLYDATAFIFSLCHNTFTVYSHLFLQQDVLLDLSGCWGYEKQCDPGKRFSYPVCDKLDSGWYCCGSQQFTIIPFA